MATDPDNVSERRPPGGPAWARPAALVVACLVIGFVGGWVLRGDDGPTTVLEASTPSSGAGSGAAGGTTAEGTTTAPGTTEAQAPAAPPARAEVGLAVLNGTDTAGLAGDTASQAESLGYEGVTAGNAPADTTGPSVVYFRAGQRPAADRVATDLEFDEVRQLPGSGALAQAAPEAAQVVVVLGPG